ncbi:histidine kinase [Pseudoxanthobacter sp. M-2]|uniref:histidine kinase n=1 Tax=Pseudoxanthobacter sp. M-2 TaxID=3078754 RepID=UPI0038FC5530
MAENETGKPGQPVTAEALRMIMLEKQMKEMDEHMARQKLEQQKRSAFAEDFLKGHIGDDERAMIRRVVMQAVTAGKLEAMIYTFPSELCTDSGRAINSADPDWPATLQGKAKELFDAYKSIAQPQGYKLKASIINFPGGMPGDVGFFLSWAPDAA